MPEEHAPSETYDADPGDGGAATEAVRRDGVLGRLRESGGLVLLAGAVAVPALLAGGIAMALHGDAEKVVPRTTATPVISSQAPRPRPLVYPTYGEYVPPRPVEKTTTRPSAPPRTTATPTPSARPSCPSGWERNPWLRHWCRRHGFTTNDS